MSFEHNLHLIRLTNMSDTIIAIDFDGTCVEHRFPEIGEEVPLAVDVLTALQNAGAKLVLWTMRSDMKEPVAGSPTAAQASDYLCQAVRWFTERRIQLFGINNNPRQFSWTDSPKAYAHIYIDDAALGCPLVETSTRPYVDWEKVAELLVTELSKGTRI